MICIYYLVNLYQCWQWREPKIRIKKYAKNIKIFTPTRKTNITHILFSRLKKAQNIINAMHNQHINTTTYNVLKKLKINSSSHENRIIKAPDYSHSSKASLHVLSLAKH